MKKRFLIILVFLLVFSGCGKVDQSKTQQDFKSEYISNLKAIRNNKYSLSWRYMDISGKNSLDMNIYMSWDDLYTDFGKLSAIWAAGLYWFLTKLDPDELFKFSQEDSYDLDLNSKYLSKLINDRFSSQDYHWPSIKADDMARKWNYIYSGSEIILDIENLKLKNIYITWQIWSWTIDLTIKKWNNYIYINNPAGGMNSSSSGSLTWGYIYSSGLMDFEISKI